MEFKNRNGKTFSREYWSSEFIRRVRPATRSLTIGCKSQFTFEEAQRIQQSYFPDLELQYLFKEIEIRLIEISYFKKYSVGRICEVLELSEDGFNKRRYIIVKRLMPLFIVGW